MLMKATPVPLERRFADHSAREREECVDVAVRRIVDFYDPVRVYLFGSQARGEARLNSDLDFLVVLRDDSPRRSILEGDVRFPGMPISIDVIPVTERWYRNHENCWASIAGIVYEEGKLMYEAAG